MVESPAILHGRNKLFQKNLQCFPDYIQQKVRQLDGGEIWRDIDIVFTDEGYPICRYREKDRLIHITSRDPLEQAKVWCKSLSAEQLGTVFVYGCGFGYALFELLKRLHEDSVVIVFEQNVYIFAAMLHFFDFEQIFSSHKKCIFFIGNYEDFSNEFHNLVSTYGMLNLTAPAIVFTPGSRMKKLEYRMMQTCIFDRLVQQISAFGNDLGDSLLGFQNMIGNIGEVVKNPYLGSLKGTFKNVPAFIVANGPSLDKNMAELKKVNGKGLILCCESAIVPLMKNEIQPDAICVLERGRESYIYHFENQEYPKEMALLALAVADPRIFSSFSGSKIPVFRNLESTSQWLNEMVGDGHGLFGGSNVSHFAYGTAVYLGANPIVFVGLDLAFGQDGVTHSRQSKYVDEVQEHIEDLQSMPVVYVDGNDGSLLASIQGWVEFRKGLEQMIEQTPQITVVNATEGGAKIKGASYGKLANVIETYCQDDLPYPLHRLLNENKKGIDVQTRMEKLQTLVTELKKYIGMYRALGKYVRQRMEVCTQLLEQSEQQRSFDSVELLRKAYQLNTQVIFTFLQPYIHHLFFQQVILFGYHQLNELGALRSLRRLREAIEIQIDLFHSLNIVCQSVVENFQIALRKVSTEMQI